MLKIVVATAALTLSLLGPTQAAEVRSASGVRVSVSGSAQTALQCVVNYVESHGVKIKYMRGFGHGTVTGSLHPAGEALDINQTARNRTKPHVPPEVSNAAADHCGVISGARWGYADNGHWNLATVAHRRHGRVRVAARSEHIETASADHFRPW